ncbi:plexin-B1 isoform X1 [Erpetoichthys calabaricus]|uniref:Plexin-B1 n=1 Tax=Erpetoichthys calabaricus TaxID=27687 RepID=A0A8C4TL55_ERPCA|nr:plexin-B1 isoform X1 [Erpetoichthys calabaricus]XP_028680883.1 plexin-B1 isoform X1 [Erpetoichthys calabaricus]XP_028680884.1 plexin-B1 isoform X1 [Erpetoichthys calabaricus]XP_028680885.1 plexin-B1 isoform X1 [Erpetoichthys calabaricus]
MFIMPPGIIIVSAALCVLCRAVMTEYESFTREGVTFEHLVLHPDPQVGMVYVGAKNHLFQLTADLRLRIEEKTGPVRDNKECLPPITDSNCPQARDTNNHNKLLLVNLYSQELITCGSVYQGICEKRSLESIKTVTFRTIRPVDTQYVAANDPNVTTVGLVVLSKDHLPVVFVGRGYTSSHPPISTRNLKSPPIFSYEETAKLAVAGRLSEYDHHFVKSFSHQSSVYFLFYRRDLKSQSREYKTYISRICLDDVSYYSYVEVPLVCQAQGKKYNLLQAAHVGQPGDDLAGRQVTTRGFMLFGVFSTWQTTLSKPGEESALCMYTLEEIDRRINETQDACYTQEGRSKTGTEAAYIEYDVKSNCANLPSNTLEAFPCGSDHTPTPMASRIPVEATPVFDSPQARLTAVAVTVLDKHTIAFLGDSQGNLNKIFLPPSGVANKYSTLLIQKNGPINSDLLLDEFQEFLYIMTPSMVVRQPVAECSKHLDCQSCLATNDPYCGWCVLKGRCGRRSECRRSESPGQWLWSYDQQQQCLTVQSLSPSNISREEKRNIFLSIPKLPTLGEEESYSCFFEDYESLAVITETGATCSSPDANKVPPIGQGLDHVNVTLSLRFLNITVTSIKFTFYDCSAVKQLSRNMPCQACVKSQWGCHWCVHQHLCTHKPTCEEGTIIYNEHFILPGPPSPTARPTIASPATMSRTTDSPTPEPTTALTTTATTPTTTTTVSTTAAAESIFTRSPPTTTEPTTFPSTTEVATIQPHVTTTLESVTVPSVTSTIIVSTVTNLETVPDESLNGNFKENEMTEDPLATSSPTVYLKEPVPLPEPSANEEFTNTNTVTTQISSTVQPMLIPLTVPFNPSNDTEDLEVDQSTDETFHVALPTSLTPVPAPVDSSHLGIPAASEVPVEILTTKEPPLGFPDLPLDSNTNPVYVAEDIHLENETATFSATTILSGDGDVENSSPGFVHVMDSDAEYDYQYDMPGFYQLGLDADPVSQGPEECPCVEKVQGSSLLPVNTKREITLVGRNLHLFQDPDYTCVFVIEGQMVMVDALVKTADEPLVYYIMCQPYQYTYSAPQEEYNATVYIKRRDTYLVDSSQDLYVTLYNCSVGRSDCSRCHTADSRYSCVWCGGEQSSCIYSESCTREIEQTCPAPVIDSIDPLSGLVEGGTTVTITGSNLGQKFQDVEHTVSVAGMRCTVDPQRYEISTRIVCITTASDGPKSGQVSVEVNGGGHGGSTQVFTYQDPVLDSITPLRGPKAGGTNLTIRGAKLLTGRPSEISILVGDIPCAISSMLHEDKIECLTGKSNATAEATVTIHYGQKERHLQNTFYHYTEDPNITQAGPSRSFLCGGRMIHVFGNNLDVVQQPKIQVTISPKESWRTRRATLLSRLLKRHRRIVPDARYPQNTECFDQQFIETCTVNSSSLILCKTPAIDSVPQNAEVKLEFIMDNLRFDFNSVSQTSFSYEDNPVLKNLSDSSKPYRHKPGSVISVEGDNLDLAISKEEVLALIGDGVCAVKTLSRNHLYCEPPLEQPSPRGRKKRDISDSLPEFIVFMGNLKFTLGKVQYDTPSPSTFPLEAQIGVGVGASIVALIVLIIVLVYRRKSKQALRDYKKVQIQLENLETSVRDRCKKEFTDLMTEMMDMSSDLVGTGIPFLDYKMYAERIFFPGHRESPLRRDLDVQDCRRQTVEQGLVQLSNLLNSKLFLTKFIYTLECQRTFSPRDRAYVASLLTVSLHGKLEYFTDILKTLLNDLVEQYVAKNPKLMLRRTETVVEKLLTNWMSICLYAFLRDFAGESLYMLFRAIKHQVDKGPVDAVTGKAKYTLNDNRLLREDVEYRTLTLNVLMQGAGNDSQPMQTKALDCDTITQVKEKVLDQVYKGTSYSHRPHTDSLDLEWRSGVAGHLILSDEDLTSVVQGSWKRLNTLQHYKVPDGATVALVPRNSKHIHHENHDYMAGEKTPMLEDADEGGIKLWHLVKASEEPELPKHRRGSLRERERAKAIPEIYLTRLLSMKGTLQKFVDDLFQVILSTSRPVPLAVKYFFDLLDDQAVNHGISDPETIHIWKTNSLPLRFWINIIKNPQFIFDVQASDNVDAVLSVIAQTFMDSCTIAEHKLGRDSPINKLLYARDIPRYKQMVERYYADIRQTISASDQEMNSALAELSRNYSGELNYLVALHELYKYINKYYDQIITALEEDPTAQKMQLGYRLQQIAAAVENKVTDL